jgi:hypothetical protein
MANKNILLVMLAITLVFGLTFIGCDVIDSVKGGDESFVGTWSGTFKPTGEEEIEATIIFTATKWTLTAVGYNQSGPYEKSSIPNTVALKIQGLPTPIGTASVTPIAETLTIIIPTGSGSFKSGESNTGDSFVGLWTGNYKELGEQEVPATITFTDNTWSLKYGSETINGSYTKSSIGYTATLTVLDITFGTAVLNPITKTLTVTVGPNKGSFERQTQ